MYDSICNRPCASREASSHVVIHVQLVVLSLHKARRRKLRTTPEREQGNVEIPSDSFSDRIMPIQRALFTRRQPNTSSRSPYHHPIEGASPVQRVTSLTRVWAKIPFDNRSGDLYITMQQLEFPHPDGHRLAWAGSVPEMTRGFLGRGSASIFGSGVAQCRGTRILHRRTRSGTPGGGKSRFPNFIVSIPKIVDELCRCHVGSSLFWLSQLR